MRIHYLLEGGVTGFPPRKEYRHTSGTYARFSQYVSSVIPVERSGFLRTRDTTDKTRGSDTVRR